MNCSPFSSLTLERSDLREETKAYQLAAPEERAAMAAIGYDVFSGFGLNALTQRNSSNNESPGFNVLGLNYSFCFGSFTDLLFRKTTKT
tara:strand:- start:15 stop:281 length:267 start_codon:yes stop_codon:yes gene_type:complete